MLQESIGGRDFQIFRKASVVEIYDKLSFLINTTEQKHMLIFYLN